jgi:glycerophosphoryl diester phosphodiesterase
MAGFKKVAHRGASGEYPESTRLALLKAIEARADVIEIDCQMTRDGHVVVFHDEDLKRTARVAGRVRDKTLEELKKLDIGRWRKKAFRGERILTLEEALEVVAGRADLCLEIKSYDGSPPGIEIKVLFTLSHYEYLDRTVLSSFDYRCLARIRELAPEAVIGLVFGPGSAEDPFAAAEGLGAASIHVQKQLASRHFFERAWQDGLDVYVWTVNEMREIETFASLGAQGLISDFPARLWKMAAR